MASCNHMNVIGHYYIREYFKTFILLAKLQIIHNKSFVSIAGKNINPTHYL